MAYTYPYPRPSLTVDAVVFRKTTNKVEALLIQRSNPPFEGGWALPGGFVDMHETLEQAVARELKEETHLSGIELTQLHTFSAVHRDPRGRTITVVFWGLLTSHQDAVAGDDARHLAWFRIDQLPQLAFDHDEVLKMAITALQNLTTNLQT